MCLVCMGNICKASHGIRLRKMVTISHNMPNDVYAHTCTSTNSETYTTKYLSMIIQCWLTAYIYILVHHDHITAIFIAAVYCLYWLFMALLLQIK